MTLGAYYVQAHSFAIEPLLASIPVGLLIAAVLWINEFPDMDADNAVGKKTLVLRLGYARSNCVVRSEEHTSELQSQSNLVCRLLLEKTKTDNCYKASHLA